MNVHLADPQTISKKFPNRGGGGGGGVGVGGVGATSLGQTSAAASAKRTSLHNLMNADGDQHHPYLSSPSPSSHHTTPATSSANTPTTTGNANANNNNNNNPLVRSSSNNPISISGLLNNPNPTLLPPPPPPPPPPSSSSSSSSQQHQHQHQQQQHYRSSHQQYTQQPLAPPPPPPQAHSASSLSPAPPSISAPPTTTTTTTNKPASSRTTATISSAAAANSAASGSLTVPIKSTSSKPRSTKARASASTASTAAAAAAAASASASANTSNANVATNSSNKSRSPSPFRLPPPPPPLQTIRLDISLGGPDKYEIDIAMLAKESGQRPPTPEPVKRYNSSDSEGEGAGAGGAGDGEDDEGEDGEGKKKKKKKRKRAAMSDYYDTTDPFIDDTELEIDHRTTFAQTKQQGFYVSSGEVALVKDKSRGKKPKRSLLGPHNDNHTGAPSSAAHPKTANKSKHDGPGPGSKDHPIDLSADDAGTSISTHRRRSGGGDDDEDEEEDGEEDGEDAVNAISAGLVGLGGLAQDLVGEKRKRYTIVVTEEGKKRKVVDVTSFHPALQESMAQLRLAIRQEDWTQRGKFPQTLKPLLNNLALQSIKLDEYDEHFFNYMPELFPYNKFTMRKLIKRTVFPDHITLLVNRQDEILEDLKQEARAGFAKAEEEWEKSVVAWDKRQEKARAEAASASASAVAPHSTSVDGTGGGGTGAGSDSNGPTRQGSEEMMDVDQPGEHTLMDGVDMNEYDPLSAAPLGSLSAYSMGASTATATATALGSGTAAGKASTRDQHPPAKRYRMTEGMKNKVWQLVLLSNECCRLENEKNTLEGSGSIVSEQGHRKQLYQRIVAAFPEGWMNSGQISREVSAMKKRFEKEAMDEEP